jgi:hypothetical protein
MNAWLEPGAFGAWFTIQRLHCGDSCLGCEALHVTFHQMQLPRWQTDSVPQKGMDPCVTAFARAGGDTVCAYQVCRSLEKMVCK